MISRLQTISLLTLSLSLQSTAQDYFQLNNVPVTEGVNNLANPWVGGMNSMQFSTIDLNDDGVDDLFCFDRTANKVITYINNGTPNTVDYEYAPEYEKAFPAMTNWVLLRDYNCDGKKDIFTNWPGGIRVYKNVSNGGNLQFVNAEGLTFNIIYSYQNPNNINLYVSSTDIPAIEDIDGDGDIDVLTFGIIGAQVEYHRNLSMEMYGVCDSLEYELRNKCWGHFTESSSTNDVFLDTCHQGNMANPEYPQPPGDDKPIFNDYGERHSGSTLLALDLTGDHVKELILGDVSFTNLVALYNEGPVPNIDSKMVSKDTLFPSNTISTDLWIFPAGFYEDINNDGVRDLLVSTNSFNQSEDINSVWHYANLGNDSIPNFNFQQDNLFQEDMIDVGTASKPIFFDHNQDGLMDLIVSNLGYYDRTSNTYVPSLSLYENIGTDSVPEFDLISNDYEGLSTLGLPTSLYPAFADLDGDGDEDMLLGDAAGNLHYFENIAPIGSDANFVLSFPYYEDNDNVTIDIGNDASPALYDLDGDNDYDLIIGTKQGHIVYMDNIGTNTLPSFKLISQSFGSVNVKTVWDQYGYSTPTLYRNKSGETELYVGCNQGWIWKFDSIDNNLSASFNLVDSIYLEINTGVRSSPTTWDLNSDSLPEILVGNYRGGISYFGSIDTVGLSISSFSKIDFNIYPNPTDDGIWIEVDPSATGTLSFSISDISGRLIAYDEIKEKRDFISLSNFAPGLYVITVSNGISFRSRKIIKK